MNDLKSQIAAACASTAPRTKARNNALAAVRWVIKSAHGYLGLAGSLAVIIDRDRAQVFDGRDNHESKLAFYRAVTGDDTLTVELV